MQNIIRNFRENEWQIHYAVLNNKWLKTIYTTKKLIIFIQNIVFWNMKQVF